MALYEFENRHTGERRTIARPMSHAPGLTVVMLDRPGFDCRDATESDPPERVWHRVWQFGAVVKSGGGIVAADLPVSSTLPNRDTRDTQVVTESGRPVRRHRDGSLSTMDGRPIVRNKQDAKRHCEATGFKNWNE